MKLVPEGYFFGPFAGDIITVNLTWKNKEIQLSRVKLSGDDFIANIYGKIDLSQPMVDLGFNVADLNLAKLLQVFNKSEIAVTGKLGGLVKVTGDPFRPEIRVSGESRMPHERSSFQGELERIIIKTDLPLSH